MRNTASVQVPTERLPLWMQQARARVDWGIVFVLAFSLLAGWAFIVQPGLPQTNASENHVFLAADYAQALGEGRLYPRWSAHALYGYGAPVPHFSPPVAPYTVALIDTLFTNDIVDAARIAYILALCLAGCATYALILRFADADAALVGSLLYVFSPYVGLIAPHILGDLPGMLGLALLPTLLWSLGRLLDLHAAIDFALLSLIAAALLLTDPALWFVTYLLAGMLILHYARNTHRRRGRVLWSLMALSAGPLMTGFFWLPAIIDQGAVTWMTNGNIAPVYRLAWPDIISPLHRIDLGAMLPDPQFTLGLPALATLIPALGAMIRRQPRLRQDSLLLVAGGGLVVFALLAAPTEVWLLGPASFCLAVGGSALTAWRDRLPAARKVFFLPLVMVLLLALALPVWLSPRWDIALTADAVTPRAQLEYAQNGYGVPVLPPGAAVPATVNPPLSTDRFLDAGYAEGTINRITADQSTASRRLNPVATRTHSDRYQAAITEDGAIRILRAYFPGWQATIDGQAVPATAEPNTGLLQVRVNAGQNGELRVFMGSTIERQRAWLASWLTFALVALLTLRRMRRPPAPYLPSLSLMAITEARLIGLIVVGFAGIMAGFTGPNTPMTLHARPGHGLDNTLAVRGVTEIGLELISFDISNTRLRVGDSFSVTLAWRRLAREGIHDIADYQVYLHLTNDDQNVRWQVFPHQEPGAHPTSRWPLEVYVLDTHHLTLSGAVVPGTYRLGVEITTCEPICDPLRRLTFEDGQQALLLTSVITVTG